MGKKSKCTCRHAGQCPVNDYCHPLARTYLDGTKVFRQLSKDEQSRSRLSRSLQGRVQVLHKPETGDQVATDGQGNTDVVAKALDPERAVAYAQRLLGKRKCKAQSFMWRALHGVPKDDLVIQAVQCPEEADSESA